MVKKVDKKTTNSDSNEEIQKLLIENSVALQKVLTKLTSRFDILSEQMSKLLGLFEISAKSFVANQGGRISKEDKDFLEKLDRLIDQNKTIARGLTLVEEKIKHRPAEPSAQFPPRRQPLPRF